METDATHGHVMLSSDTTTSSPPAYFNIQGSNSTEKAELPGDSGPASATVFELDGRIPAPHPQLRSKLWKRVSMSFGV